MNRLVVSSIVEGHGEVKALPRLIGRVGRQIQPDLVLNVLEPIRIGKGKFLNREDERNRVVELAARKASPASDGAIVVLLDADDDCPAELGPTLRDQVQAVRKDFRFGLTVAKREFEAWFVAAAESLRGVNHLAPDLQRPNAPEEISDAKGWLKTHSTLGRYSETLDQPVLSSAFDIDEARTYSDSFDKFWRELHRIICSA